MLEAEMAGPATIAAAARAAPAPVSRASALREGRCMGASSEVGTGERWPTSVTPITYYPTAVQLSVQSWTPAYHLWAGNFARPPLRSQAKSEPDSKRHRRLIWRGGGARGSGCAGAGLHAAQHHFDDLHRLVERHPVAVDPPRGIEAHT